MLRCSSRFVVMLIAVFAMGCAAKLDDRLPVFPVSGSAKYNGEPMGGASIVLIPESPSPLLRVPPFGRIEEDGTFEITSYATGDGAPAGKYKVTFTWSDGDPDSPSDLFAGRYSDPRKPVASVTIEEGSNELPAFELKGPPIKLPPVPAST